MALALAATPRLPREAAPVLQRATPLARLPAALGAGDRSEGASSARRTAAAALAAPLAVSAAALLRRRRRTAHRRFSHRWVALGSLPPEAAAFVPNEDVLQQLSLAALPVVAAPAWAGSAVAMAAAILCHEAGHFLCARSVGLRSEEFSLGFGPVLLDFGRDAGGTAFSFRLVPFGGYVRFDERKTVALEDGTMVNEFEAIPVAARVLVLSGGVVANMIVAWASLVATALTTGIPRSEPMPGIKVESVGEDALNAGLGLRPNDVLLGIRELDLNSPNQSVQATVSFIKELQANTPVDILVNRGGQVIHLDVTPLTDPKTGMQRLGVMINSNSERIMAKASGFADAASVAASEIQRILQEQLIALQNLAGGTGAEVVGPVGIVAQGEQFASSEGLIGLVLFFVTVNLNLAFVNVLPVPGLDGGKVVVTLFEKLQGRRMDDRVKQDLEGIFILLIILSVLGLSAKDVVKLLRP